MNLDLRVALRLDGYRAVADGKTALSVAPDDAPPVRDEQRRILVVPAVLPKVDLYAGALSERHLRSEVVCASPPVLAREHLHRRRAAGTCQRGDAKAKRK